MNINAAEHSENDNDKRTHIMAWTPSTDIQDGPSLKSKETCEVVIDQDTRYTENQEDKHEAEQLMKIAQFFKMFVLIFMTLVTFGILVWQGSICISK